MDNIINKYNNKIINNVIGVIIIITSGWLLSLLFIDDISIGVIWWVIYIIVSGYGFKILLGGDINNIIKPLPFFYFVLNIYFIIGFLMWLVWEIFLPLPSFFKSFLHNPPYPLLYAGYTGLVSVMVFGILGKKITEKYYFNENQFIYNEVLNKSYLENLSWFVLIIGFLSAYIVFAGFKEAPIFVTTGGIDYARTEAMKRGGGTIWFLYNGLVFLPSIIYIKIEGNLRRLNILDCIKILSSTALLSLYAGRFMILSPYLMVILVYLQGKRIPRVKLAAFFLIMMTSAMLFVAYRNYGTKTNIDLALAAATADFFPEMRTFAAAAVKDEGKYGVNIMFTNLFISLIPSKALDLVGVDKEKYVQPFGVYLKELFPEVGNIPGLRTGWIGEWYISGGILWVLLSTGLIAFIIGCLDNKLAFSKNLEDKYIIVIYSFIFTMVIPYGPIYLPWVLVMGTMAHLYFKTIPRIFNKSVNK
jgi:hypothetical protein